MLESHHCPFGTAEAPCGFNRAQLQNPMQGHTHTHKKKNLHSKIHSWVLIFCVFTKFIVLWLYILSMQTVYSVFSTSFVNSGFWARGRLYTVSIGEKIKRSCSPSWKKIEAGGELNCTRRGLGCDDKAAAGK